MTPITTVLRKTDSVCFCGGTIVEHFSTKYGKSNGIIGPGSRRSSCTTSDGFGCEKCGVVFGEPVYKTTEPNSQILFELSLYTAILKKKITEKDIEPHIEYQENPQMHPIRIGSRILKATTHTPISVPAKSIPTELASLNVGDTVYLLPNENSRYNPHRKYGYIQLTTLENAPRFSITFSCIK